jgi:hypothetical protein
MERPLNKFLPFLFITCGLCFTPCVASADEAGVNSSAKLGSAQSQNIGEEETEPKDPLLATVFAVMPGIVFHGFGNFYAGDYDDGTRMLTVEIFGGGLALWGNSILHNPSDWGPYFGADAQSAGYWIEAGGVALMAASWVWDVSTAGQEAQSFNKDHDINFRMDSRYDGLQFAISKRF